jgi:pimeloyl-ACP methyl ester carboxylesterase
LPWRKFRWHKGQKHYSGLYWSATMRRRSRISVQRPALLDTSADGTALAVADRAPVHAELNGIHVPTLVAVGADDVATPRTKVGRIAVAINGTRLEVVAGSGHSSPLEQSIALTTPLRDFLTSVGNR